MSKDVFISHSSIDRDAAAAVTSFLEERGVSCWMAPRDVRPGADYAVEIMGAIEQVRALVLLLSEHANGSPAVASEVEAAFSARKPIFPTRLQEVEPSRELAFFVRRSHWLDAFRPPLEAHLPRLVEGLRPVLGTPGAERISRAPGPRQETFERALARLGARSFVFAREAVERAALQAIRRAPSPVLLQGLPGVGKTTLLGSLARQLRSDFPHALALRFEGPSGAEVGSLLEDLNEFLCALGRGLPAQDLRSQPERLSLDTLLSRSRPPRSA